ncbi:DUF2116 family Zn-ribbon domain-containing protein [Pseudomonas sp. S9]|uniref:DUF2116 family Zn-ribbon domain-containing protein n=1 Tax=Pseudomonas sp. S9 TaxID=686578 RepID=UPI000A006679
MPTIQQLDALLNFAELQERFKPVLHRTCVICGEPLARDQRPHTKTCSSKCRSRLYRARQEVRNRLQHEELPNVA